MKSEGARSLGVELIAPAASAQRGARSSEAEVCQSSVLLELLAV